MTNIYCVWDGEKITVVYGVDISQYPWIEVPDGYTSMPTDDPRYAAWYDALPAAQQPGAIAPGA